LRFAKVDADAYPSLAERNGLNMDGLYVSLPLIILYRNGEEVFRYPANDKNGKPISVKHYKEKEIIRMFDLETIYDNCKRHAKE
jgi:hypothetical protein